MGEILDAIIAAERECGKILLTHNEVHTISKTSSRDVVTEYDTIVQKELTERLSEAVRGACFFCEEDGRRENLNAEHVFIIDPIDGTMNFTRHMRLSCISVAYASFGEVIAAAVYNPFMDELFYAEKGCGAFLNGKPIHAEQCRLNETIVACGTSPYQPEMADYTFEIMKKLFLKGLDIRRLGSAELDFCYIAAGREGLYVEPEMFIWDYAAGALIAAEAGAITVDYEGKEPALRNFKTGIICGCETAVRDFFNDILEKPLGEK